MTVPREYVLAIMWVLYITDIDSEELVDEIELVNVDTDELRQFFDQPITVSMAGEWVVGEAQADVLAEYIDDGWDFEHYDYVIKADEEELDDDDDADDDDDYND
jgi:hypothetical protein